MTVYKLAAAIFLTLCAEATAQTSFWTNSAVPATKEESDTQSVTARTEVLLGCPRISHGRPLL